VYNIIVLGEKFAVILLPSSIFIVCYACIHAGKERCVEGGGGDSFKIYIFIYNIKIYILNES